MQNDNINQRMIFYCFKNLGTYAFIKLLTLHGAQEESSEHFLHRVVALMNMVFTLSDQRANGQNLEDV